MNKVYQLLFWILLVYQNTDLFAQAPTWINYSIRESKYPSSEYFTGFVSQYFEKKEDLAQLRSTILQNARATLSENIKISIKSTVLQKTFNFNSVTREEFKKVSTSYSAIELTGSKSEVYVNEKRREIYGFASVEKSKVRDYYLQIVNGLLANVKKGIEIAEEYSKNKDNPQALKIYSGLLTAFREIEEAQTILLICGVDDDRYLRKAESDNLSLGVSKRIAGITSNRDLTLGEVSSFLAFSLRSQLEESIKEVSIGNLLFEETTMASSFSDRFKTQFLQSLSEEGFHPVNNSSSLEEPPNDYRFIGNYWVGKEDLHIIVNLFSLRNGERFKILASSEAYLSINTLENLGIDFQPKNFSQAYQRESEFGKDQIQNGGMQIDLWTNKGDQGLVYKEGESLKILVRVNRPSYLRIVNYWADGTKILLLDNHYLDETKVNKLYELPFEWETACPCGVEFLQANAQSVSFSSLNVESRDDFLYITDDMDEILENTRGFKNKVSTSNEYLDEVRLTITTLPIDF